MHKFRSFSLILLFGFLLIPVKTIVAQDQGKNSPVTYSDVNKVILVKQSSPTFSIILHSNPTTGFRWILRDYDANLVIPICRKYYYPKTKLIGAGGYEKWNFRITPKGFKVPLTTSITLIYARSWNLEGAEVSRFKVVTANDY